MELMPKNEITVFDKLYFDKDDPKKNYNFIITNKKMYLIAYFSTEFDPDESYVDNKILTCTYNVIENDKMLYTASYINLPDDFELTEKKYKVLLIDLEFRFLSFTPGQDCIYDIYYLFIERCIKQHNYKKLEKDVQNCVKYLKKEEDKYYLFVVFQVIIIVLLIVCKF
jgi:hypothetical protein